MPPRIETAISPNDPKTDKHCQADKIPPDKFPVYLSLTLSQKELLAVEKIKSEIAHYPKDRLRIRTSKNLYCSSVDFRCYFADQADLQSFSHTVLTSGTNLVKSYALSGEMPYTSITLAAEAHAVYQTRSPSVAPASRLR